MTFIQILTLVLQALLVRTTSFAFTLGTNHFSATITDTGVPGNSGSFIAILSVLATILAEKPGTFTIGVFTIVLVELVPAPAA